MTEVCEACDFVGHLLEVERHEHEVTKGYRQHVEYEREALRFDLAATKARLSSLLKLLDDIDPGHFSDELNAAIDEALAFTKLPLPVAGEKAGA